MKTLAIASISIGLMSGVASFSALADDNIAACEIVVQQPVISPEEEKETDTEATPMISTFFPADDFVYSVFDSTDGHLTEVDGHPIQAVMCKRRYLIPTEFDLRLIVTQIPLYLSQEFDSSDSDLMAVYFKEGKYEYRYSGSDLSDDSLEIMDIRIKTLNAQEN